VGSILKGDKEPGLWGGVHSMQDHRGCSRSHGALGTWNNSSEWMPGPLQHKSLGGSAPGEPAPHWVREAIFKNGPALHIPCSWGNECFASDGRCGKSHSIQTQFQVFMYSPDRFLSKYHAYVSNHCLRSSPVWLQFSNTVCCLHHGSVTLLCLECAPSVCTRQCHPVS
jgi:hypothetical protein